MKGVSLLVESLKGMSVCRMQITNLLSACGCNTEWIGDVLLAVAEVANNFLVHAGEKRLRLYVGVVCWGGRPRLLVGALLSRRSLNLKTWFGLVKWVTKGVLRVGSTGEHGHGARLFFVLLTPIVVAVPGAMFYVAPAKPSDPPTQAASCTSAALPAEKVAVP